MTKRKVAVTPLARWLNQEMARAEDPETGEIGLSTFRLAQLMDVSQTFIWDILKNGLTPKRLDKLVELGRFFGKSPMFVFRLAYMSEYDPSPEVENSLLEIEDIMAKVPPSMQEQYISSLLQQAKMLYTAAVRWSETEREPES